MMCHTTVKKKKNRDPYKFKNTTRIIQVIKKKKKHRSEPVFFHLTPVTRIHDMGQTNVCSNILFCRFWTKKLQPYR